MTLREEIDQIEEDIERADDELMDANHTETQIENLQDRVNELELTLKALTKCNDVFELWHEIDQATGRLIVESIDRIDDRLHSIDMKLFELSVSVIATPTPPAPNIIPQIDSETLVDAIEIFKATVAAKKQELAAGVEPSTTE